MLKSRENKPALFIKHGGELSLSDTALIEIIRAVLGKGRPFRFKANGFSMSPFIRDGDVITVFPLLDNLPRLGEVVACILPESRALATHRIIGEKNGLYILQGDNVPKADGLLPKVDILGCVQKVERAGKRVSLGLGSERFLIVLFLRYKRILFPLALPVWRLIRPFIRRWAV